MIAAILQARMGSTRLPGKVLADIEGHPLVWHIVQRVKASRRVDQVLVATSTHASDAPLKQYLDKQKIPVFLGSEQDVLDRYYQAARSCGASVIARVTCDDPFKDPYVIDQAIDLLLEAGTKTDYAANCSYDGSIAPTYPEGLDIEVMTFGCLEKLWQRAKLPSEREHVTPYLFKHPEDFKIRGFSYSKNLSHLRWTLDYDRDLEFARAIYKRLYARKPLFRMQDILDLLEQEPALKAINAGITRNEGYLKSLKEDPQQQKEGIC
jgi:spore coat polysaccharide biosynthesis protein SpsF